MYVNFTAFTEVDPNAVWSQTSTRSTSISLGRYEDSYVYKDYGASNFGDYVHDLDIRIHNSGTEALSFQGLWAITNNPASNSDMVNGQVLYTYCTSLDNYSLVLKDEGNSQEDSWTGFQDDTIYYLKISRSGTTATCKIYPTANDRTNDTNVIDTLTITCQNTAFRYIMGGFSLEDTSAGDKLISGYIENLDLNIPTPTYEGSDTLTVSDEIELSVSREKAELGDSVVLSDDLRFQEEQQESEDTPTLNEQIEFLIKQEKEENLGLSDEIEFKLSPNLEDSLTIGDEIEISTIELSRNDIVNMFGMVTGTIEDINNKVGMIAENKSNINNRVGFLKSWQVAGDAGYQSLGKTYVKLYINDVEQTDVIIDSISISQITNSSHTTSFELGRPYDNTKPDMEAEVEIKYHIWRLYKGYITQITPTSSPEKIKIICQDEYWKQNKTKKYFNVGHKPTDDQELYYSHISEGLLACDVNFDIGNFVPQTINCFGEKTSDCITQLVTDSGNYAWYYNVEGAKELWTAGLGDIINLERQEIGKNLGLYQVITHSFKDSIENIANKFRVQMGDMVIRRFNNTGGSKEYASYRYKRVETGITPAWNSAYEVLDDGTVNSYGIFFHPIEQNWKYEDVYCKYNLPAVSSTVEKWTDVFPPKVRIYIPFGGSWKLSVSVKEELGFPYLKEGFTVDLEKQELTFNEPIYLYQTDSKGRMTATRAPMIKLILYKKQYYSNTESSTDNPITDISNPLMFFTDKMGDYADTILDNLDLNGLGIQIGGWYISGQTDEGKNIYTYVPSWDDTNFAKDYADWELTKRCDKKISGTIKLSIDAMCFYGIKLNKRIMINGIIENPMNIKSISYDINNWQATIQLENDRYYKRTVSFQSRGE